MALQSGIEVTIAYKDETTFNTRPGATGAQYMRSVQSTLGIAKDTYQSNERRRDQQVADMRHGTRRGQGAVEGEFSLGTYDAWLGHLVRNTWTNGATLNVSVTISDNGRTITRSAGSWLTDGVRLFDVIRLGTGAPAATQNKNHVVVGVTALVLSLLELPGADLGSAAPVEITVVGKKVTNGTLQPSICIEQTYPSLDGSEILDGCRLAGGRLQLPPTGMMTCGFDVDAMDAKVLKGATSPYFTDPADETETGIFAAVNGVLALNGEVAGTVTGLSFQFTNNVSGDPVVGKDTRSALFFGSHVATGSMTVLMENMDMLEAFANEVEMELFSMVELPAAAGVAPDFFALSAGRVKYTGANKTISAQGGVPLDMPFQMLKASATGFNVATIAFQSSAA